MNFHFSHHSSAVGISIVDPAIRIWLIKWRSCCLNLDMDIWLHSFLRRGALLGGTLLKIPTRRKRLQLGRKSVV